MNLYWIGARQWDIINNDMFSGSITRYGIDNGFNSSFCNNNYTKNYSEFVSTALHNILSIDKEAFFLFANEKNAYKFGKNIFDKSICVNQLYILESMNDKIFTRNFFSDCIKTPNSILIDSSSCMNYKFICEIFDNKYSSFVLQEAKGAGGLKNYFLSQDYMPNSLPNSSYVLVTPYFKEKLTINVHIISDGKDYRILPPSVQITLNKFKYSGSDFIAYSNLPLKIKCNVFSCASKIAQKAISIGAKGIFGVDLIILEDNVLFLECNYRYQGSSFLLNKGLITAGYPSLFKLRYDSFYDSLNDVPKDINYANIPLSSFRRTKWNEQINLPSPLEIVAVNNSDFASNDDYVRYEVFNKNIIQSIEKQEVQNLY